MAIADKDELRVQVRAWLDRDISVLSNVNVDNFIEIAEARIYEELRIPPLEAMSAFSVLERISSINIPEGLIELITLSKNKEGSCSINPEINTTRALCAVATGDWTDDDLDDDVILNRVDPKAFRNNKIPNSFIREGSALLMTDKEGNRKASGEYTLRYYKAGTSIEDSGDLPWLLATFCYYCSS